MLGAGEPGAALVVVVGVVAAGEDVSDALSLVQPANTERLNIEIAILFRYVLFTFFNLHTSECNNPYCFKKNKF
ncbi:hypothetical protein D3C85_1339860 [compost metagenome]